MIENNNDYKEFVIKTIDELKELFLEKSDHYIGCDDPLVTFRAGVKMNMMGFNCNLPPDGEYRVMFREALAYERKHLAHVFLEGVEAPRVAESLKDIALYSIIEMYIAKCYEELKAQQQED